MISAQVCSHIPNLYRKFKCSPPDTIILDNIQDENISAEGIDAVLSLITNKKQMQLLKGGIPKKLVSTLAVAHCLDIKNVIDFCGTIMTQNADETNILIFYEATKKYGLKIAMNQLFHWLEIHFMCLITDTKLCDENLTMMNMDLLVYLLTSQIFVVTSEWNLYEFLKKWLWMDLKQNNQYDLRVNNHGTFLSTELGEKYKLLFSKLRLSCLLSYPDKCHLLYTDNIFPQDELNTTAYRLYSKLLSIQNNLKRDETEDFTCAFRFAKIFMEDQDTEWANNFFSYAIILKFKFNSRNFLIERVLSTTLTPASLLNHGEVGMRIRYSLYSNVSRGGTIASEQNSTVVNTELPLRVQKTLAVWKKSIIFPCILFVELQLMPGITQIAIDDD